MNSCILMAEIVQAPQLRYTPDNVPVADMLVQFPGLRQEDPPATLKVVGWRGLAETIQEQCHEGDRVVIEGSLRMGSFERPEGFREKRAELTLQRIHRLDSLDSAMAGMPAGGGSAPASGSANLSTGTASPPAQSSASETGAASYAGSAAATDEPDLDDIPF